MIGDFVAFAAVLLGLAAIAVSVMGWRTALRQRDAAHLRTADALREVYNAINNADAIDQYDDVQRRVALRAVSSAAGKLGINL